MVRVMNLLKLSILKEENLFAPCRISHGKVPSVKIDENRSRFTNCGETEKSFIEKRKAIAEIIVAIIPFSSLIFSGKANNIIPATTGKNIII